MSPKSKWGEIPMKKDEVEQANGKPYDFVIYVPAGSYVQFTGVNGKVIRVVALQPGQYTSSFYVSAPPS